MTRLGATPIEPLKIVPIYFPAWFIDAEVEAQVLTSNGSVEGYVTGVFANSYFPGHTMDKLSSLSLLSRQLEGEEAVAFSKDLETQWDTTITCLPFQTAPLSILNAAQSLRSDHCVINESYFINPSSIRPNLISAYPVLIPLYLAQYARNTTVVLEAYSEMGRVFEEIPFDSDEEAATQDTRAPATSPGDQDLFGGLIERMEKAAERFEIRLVEMEMEAAGSPPRDNYDLVRGPGDFLSHRGKPTPFLSLSAITFPPGWDKWNIRDDFRNVQRWIHNFLMTDDFRKPDEDPMDDLRIRPFTSEEVMAVRKFLELGKERTSAHSLLDSIAKVTKTAPEDSNETWEEYVASVDAQRDDATPGWWKDWKKSATEK
ncbi:hypothetical protein C8R47DRAFT_383655 [Mycena vitilis]|nr:hypothetical protein C8R47DRAFT_383655 [Mycena vitilis]